MRANSSRRKRMESNEGGYSLKPKVSFNIVQRPRHSDLASISGRIEGRECEREISLDASLMEFDWTDGWMDGWHYWFPVDIPHAFQTVYYNRFAFLITFR